MALNIPSLTLVKHFLKSCRVVPSRKRSGNKSANWPTMVRRSIFYPSLYKDRLKEEGFEAHDFTRFLNHERPDEALLAQKIKRFKDITPNRDSLMYWYKLSNLTKWNRENLVRLPY